MTPGVVNPNIVIAILFVSVADPSRISDSGVDRDKVKHSCAIPDIAADAFLRMRDDMSLSFPEISTEVWRKMLGQ